MNIREAIKKSFTDSGYPPDFMNDQEIEFFIRHPEYLSDGARMMVIEYLTAEVR